MFDHLISLFFAFTFGRALLTSLQRGANKYLYSQLSGMDPRYWYRTLGVMRLRELTCINTKFLCCYLWFSVI